MNKIKADIIASFKNKRINVFILFLLLSFVILMFTKLSKEYTNTIIFNVDMINVPQENIILNDSAKINITLKTHGFKWLSYYWAKPKINIDFSKDVLKKDDVFVWNKSKAYLNNTQFDKDVEILDIAPDPVVFRYGINMVKKVPVILNTDIKFSPGYDITDKVISEPDSITVIGPNIIVSKIESIQSQKVTLSNVRADILEKVNLDLPINRSTDLKFSKKEVFIKGKVEKFTEGTLKVPISISNLPENLKINYFPKTVSVSYYVSLNNFNNVKSKDFKVVCDFSKTNENNTFLTPEFVKISNLVQHAKISQKRIEFIVTK